VEIYDISQLLQGGMVVWLGDPEFSCRRFQEIRDGESTNVSAVEMSVHTGTHIDAPLHLDNSGIDAAGLPIHVFVGAARVFAISVETCIQAADLAALEWQGVQRALFRTRPLSASETVFDRQFISFSEDAAEFLANKGLLLVGTDAQSVDAFGSAGMPAHRAFLNHGIAILEGIRLERVPPGDYELICLPLKLAGSDGSPVRAILRR